MTLIVEMIGMLLGRLEIFIVIIGIHSSIKQVWNSAVIRLKNLKILILIKVLT